MILIGLLVIKKILHNLDIKTLASLLVRKLAQTKRPKRHIKASTENWRSRSGGLVILKKVSTSQGVVVFEYNESCGNHEI